MSDTSSSKADCATALREDAFGLPLSAAFYVGETASFEELSRQVRRRPLMVAVDGDGFERDFLFRLTAWRRDCILANLPGRGRRKFHLFGLRPGFRELRYLPGIFTLDAPGDCRGRLLAFNRCYGCPHGIGDTSEFDADFARWLSGGMVARTPDGLMPCRVDLSDGECDAMPMSRELVLYPRIGGEEARRALRRGDGALAALVCSGGEFVFRIGDERFLRMFEERFLEYNQLTAASFCLPPAAVRVGGTVELKRGRYLVGRSKEPVAVLSARDMEEIF